MSSSPQWYETWFASPWYYRLYQHRSEEEARDAVQLLSTLGIVVPPASVLDLACGYGRHALALAEAGFDVVGVDNSPTLIGMANERYSHHRVRYVQGDMRGPLPGGPYDAVLSFFTSFGYFDDQDDDNQVLLAAHSVLREGGFFLLDFLNAPLVEQTLEAETLSILAGVTVLQERRIENNVVVKNITINDPCTGEVTYEERVRLYNANELQTMVTNAGFRVIDVLGSYSADKFNEEESNRCIVIAQRG